LGLHDRYVDALVREIERRGTGEAVDTIFFGGGTPSRTEPEALGRIVRAINERFDAGGAPSSVEFTLEANPEDVTPEAITFWRSLGVNRLSIGVQSFHDQELQPIGRIHGAQRAREAIRAALVSGVRTSIDLILGLPGQTAASFRESLREAIGSGIGHLSVYMLDLDEDTALRRRVESGLVSLPDEDIVADLYVEMIDTLQRSGLTQYEISNFARCGEESQHNLRYWRRQHYLGFGIAAHSFIDERRFANTRDIHRYIAGESNAEFVEHLSDAEARRETIFLGLRQTAGINYDHVLTLCGEEAAGWIEHGVSEGWLRRNGSQVAFTPAGFLISSELISQLF
jgi:oxygen-independent coproporphyrinogen-3 oxidase